jgi:hypothetical protein
MAWFFGVEFCVFVWFFVGAKILFTTCSEKGSGGRSLTKEDDMLEELKKIRALLEKPPA